MTKEGARTCVIVPARNDGKTVGPLIEGVLRFADGVIVVNDGSTDETGEVLARCAGIEVVTHAENQGRGAALRRGFQRALELGYDHAITIDADGRYPPEDIPRFLEALEEGVEAVWVGARNAGPAGRSRLPRRVFNFWLWAETGRRLPDALCGFRCYPLRAIADLKLETTGYEFEVEVLVKAAWTGIPLRSVPVGVKRLDGSARRSHFRPVKDFLLISHLSMWLAAVRLLVPGIMRKMYCSRGLANVSLWKKFKLLSGDLFLEGATSPSRIAASVGLGMCVGILPIWGYQMAAAVLLAHHLRLNKFLTLAAANISFPAAVPFIIYACLVTGRWVMAGELDYSLGLDGVTPTAVWEKLGEWFVGSIILALAVGAAGAAVAYVVGRLIWCIRGRMRRRDA